MDALAPYLTQKNLWENEKWERRRGEISKEPEIIAPIKWPLLLRSQPIILFKGEAKISWPIGACWKVLFYYFISFIIFGILNGGILCVSHRNIGCVGGLKKYRKLCQNFMKNFQRKSGFLDNWKMNFLHPTYRKNGKCVYLSEKK